MRELVVRESAFSRLAVLEDTVHRAHILENDHTWHGWQFRDPERLDEPTGYYARGSPVAELLERALPREARVAVVGLGAGVLAAYATPSRAFTFYEIDPAVVELARDEAYFSFLARAAGPCEVEVGDAVRRVLDAPPGRFDLVVMDAFFGPDVSPAMLSRDVVDRFASRLAPGGLLAFHVTSTRRGHDHRPALARVAPHLAGACRDWSSPPLPRDPDLDIDPDVDLSAPVECRWVALAPRERDVRRLAEALGWSPLPRS